MRGLSKESRVIARRAKEEDLEEDTLYRVTEEATEGKSMTTGGANQDKY